jgi:hypothetical protein
MVSFVDKNKPPNKTRSCDQSLPNMFLAKMGARVLSSTLSHVKQKDKKYHYTH